MAVHLKYAVVERERRFLLAMLPEGVVGAKEIVDCYAPHGAPGWRGGGVDEHQDGTLIAEIDDGDQPSQFVPDWLDVVANVSDDERWTGIRLAR